MKAMTYPLADFSGLYAIVDTTVHRVYGVERLLKEIVCQTQVPVIQLRVKGEGKIQSFDPGQALEAVAETRQRLVAVAIALKRERPFHLIVNDDAGFLHGTGVDGVHLGQGDTNARLVRQAYPGKIVGVSAHDIAQARQAAAAGADYIGCGAVFASRSKAHTADFGLRGLAQIVTAVDIPTVAIGGIDLGNIRAVAQTGCAMAAVIAGLIQGGVCVAGPLHQEFLAAIARAGVS